MATKMRIGDPVWLRAAKGATEPFEQGKVVNVQQNGARLTVLDASGNESAFDAQNADVFPSNPPGSTAPDHCGLIHLNEPSILENSRARYVSGSIYTYTGKILIALNPFEQLPLYSESEMSKYKDKDVGARGAEPHVYAMGEAAFRHVKRYKAAAAIVMSGESGAGKTETTKHIMRYLAWRSEAISKRAEGKLTSLADAILKSNPLLEAFGNAKTVRNNNSSRFGKMMRLHFEATGAVAGAFIKTYLLEKSRSVAITDPERNYHIFYQLCAGAPDELKGAALSKLAPAQLRMLSQSKCITLSGKDDREDYEVTVGAMQVLGIPRAEQAELFRVLSALLLLGNVQYTQDDHDHAVFAPGTDAFVAAAEEMLQCGPLTRNLTSREMKAKEKGPTGRRSSFYTIEYTQAQAEAVRDAVIKAIYTHLFDWIVDKINKFIQGSEAAAALPYVGLLDIFGFENFTHNSFEQLCINFANEKLQQFFLTQVFKEEEALHVLEGVPWKEVEYQDNSACIDLLEKPPNGIFRLLDSQCKAPNASEEALCKELNQLHAKGGFLAPPRLRRMRDEEGFIVRHYAGDVAYHSSAVVAKATGSNEVSFLDKNNDTLQEDWLAQLASSEVPLLQSLFLPGIDAAAKANRKAASFSSVGKRFVNDLNSLLAELKASKAHFVRCVKPSAASQPRAFEAPLVLDQLRCAGVVEAVRVMTEAYPTRIPYEVIHGRYAPLMGQEVLDCTGDEPAAFCEAVAQACDVAPRDYALGMTKLFLKAGCGGFLEDLASMDVAVVVPLLVRKIAESKRKKGAEAVIGHSVHGWFMRKKYKEKRAAAALAQHRMRTIKAKREYRAWSEARQARLAKEAGERALRAAEAAAAAAAAEVARAAAMDAQLKDAAVAEAVSKAKAEAEARVAVEMAAAVAKVEAAAAENAALNAAKQSVDRRRPDFEGRRASSTALGLRRASASTVCPAEIGAHSPDGALAAAEASRKASSIDEPSLLKARSEYSVTQEEMFDVVVVRDSASGTLGIAVDLWDGEVTVGAISTGGPADREGTLVQGDVIKAVEGAACATIEEVTVMVVKGPSAIRLSVVRRPVSVVLESEIRMRMPTGEWEPFAFRLLSNRNIEFEKLSPPVYAGEIHARLAQSLRLLEPDAVGGGEADRVLEIVTGHKHFQIQCAAPHELDMWQLRLQEVIMLQEKVANVAHGWLLKEEPAADGGSGAQFKHYWFVLFSNGILMYFEGPQRAVLGQALGFVPVEACHEHAQAHMHTITIRCSFTAWLLATKNKDSMLQWAASLKAAQPAALAGAAAKPAIDAVLAQGWCETPRDDDETGAEVWARHWFVLKPSVLQIYPEEAKARAGSKGALSVPPAVELASLRMVSATRATGVDFYRWGIVLETADGPPLRLRAAGQSEMRQLLSTLNVNCIPVQSGRSSLQPSFEKTRVQLKAGWLFKKAERRSGAPVVKAWQRRWFVLEVTSELGPEQGTVLRTAQLTYHHSMRELRQSGGVAIPLQEAKSVKSSLGRTKGTEHRLTISTHRREWELGAGDKTTADEWLALLQEWVGLPRVEPVGRASSADGQASVVRSQWMEVKVEAFKPDDISEEELTRTATLQKRSPSFGRSFSLFRNKADNKSPERVCNGSPTKGASARTASERSATPELAGEQGSARERGSAREGDDEDEDDDPGFRWVYVALLSDGTLRQYEDEAMTSELGRLRLGYLVQAAMLDEPIDDYQLAFRVTPNTANTDAWVLCPDSEKEASEWIATLKA